MVDEKKTPPPPGYFVLPLTRAAKQRKGVTQRGPDVRVKWGRGESNLRLQGTLGLSQEVTLYR